MIVPVPLCLIFFERNFDTGFFTDRLFPHLSRVCQGVIFQSVQMVQDLMATASTTKESESFYNNHR